MSGFAPLVLELVPPPAPLDCCASCSELPFLVFLDSATTSGDLGRYSFLCGDPAVVVRSKGERTEQWTRDSGTWAPIAGDPLDVVRSTLLREFAAAVIPGLPPFQGGAAGYVGYDWGTRLERIAPPRFDDLAIPDCMLGWYDWVIAWDHEQRRAWLISTGLPETGPARAHRAADRLTLTRGVLAGTQPAPPRPTRPFAHPVSRHRARRSIHSRPAFNPPSRGRALPTPCVA